MSIAAAAAQQAAADAAATGSSQSSTSQNSLNSLSGNFNSFLTMLMTQLQNQDPTSPLDTNQFTSELVHFSSVQQQIDTNTSLTQLISLTQGGELLQSSQMIGRQVTVKSDHLALQGGNATIGFNTKAAEPVAIAVFDTSGHVLHSETVSAVAGANTWAWNGAVDGSSVVAPDGTYQVVATTGAPGQARQALTTTTTGTVTGVVANGQMVNVSLGALSVDVSAIQSVAGNAA